jgi:hypothetical protein
MPGVDPRRPQPGLDLTRRKVTRHHPRECLQVDRQPRIGYGRLLCGGELTPHVARQVLRPADQPPGARLVEDQRPQRPPRLLLARQVQQLGDLAEPDLVVKIPADHQRVLRAIRPVPGRRWGHHPPRQQVSLAHLLGLLLKILQSHHIGPERVVAEPAHPRIATLLPLHQLTGGLVHTAGGARACTG